MIDRRLHRARCRARAPRPDRRPGRRRQPRGRRTSTQTHVFASDQAGVGDVQDPNLVNGWGIVHGPATPWWVANNGTDTSTLYNGTTGAPLPLVVKRARARRPGPSSTAGPGSRSPMAPRRPRLASCSPPRTARSRAGTRASRRQPAGHLDPGVRRRHATPSRSTRASRSRAGTAPTTSTRPTSTAAGSTSTTARSQRKHWDGAFRDRHLPKHYAPFGIQAINGMIFVTYARQDEAREDEIAGAGKGFVDVFTPARQAPRPGRLARRAQRAVGHRLGAGDRLRPVQRRPDRRQLRQRPDERLSLAPRRRGTSMARSGRPTARQSRSTACGGSASATTPRPDRRPPSSSPRARTTSPTAHSGPSGRPDPDRFLGSPRRVAGRSPASS